MKKLLLTLLTFSFLSLLFAANSIAKNLPYYASIKSKATEANVRTGPSIKYPIRWVYKRPNWPVKIIATFERWRKIEDIYGEAGWIHETLLSGSKFVLVKGEDVQEIYRLPIATSSVVLIAEGGVLAKIEECKNDWCKVEVEQGKGWIKKSHLWGIE